MEKDIQMGPETVLKMMIVGGAKVRLEIGYAGAQMTAGSFVELTIEEYAKLLENAIPGNVDNMIIDGLVTAMKILP